MHEGRVNGGRGLGFVHKEKLSRRRRGESKSCLNLFVYTFLGYLFVYTFFAYTFVCVFVDAGVVKGRGEVKYKRMLNSFCVFRLLFLDARL